MSPRLPTSCKDRERVLEEMLGSFQGSSVGSVERLARRRASSWPWGMRMGQEKFFPVDEQA